MRFLIRAFGWLLFALSTVFTAMGMLALGGMMQDPAGLLGIELSSKNDRVLWMVVWLLGMLAGLWLAKPKGKRTEPQDILGNGDADRR